MEKAFDRVSYDFTLRGLQALGFGPKFRKWVGMMYDTNNAPQRRMYVNGYHSEWFTIKSGVAQGCQLSPLLFLIVAQALKFAIHSEKKLKGIKIGSKSYKISQFADDTVLFLRSLTELKYANRPIRKWCRATGMRENVKKREGLAMGTLAGQDLGHDIRWTPNGKWCTSLEVPIGNKLDEAKWWGAKINTVRKIATQWLGLKRAKYMGRNLIVQGCYYGRLRYWLYSINMNKSTAEIVQRDANILWWSRDPTLEIMENQDGTAGKI